MDARLLSYAWGLEHAKEAAALAVAAAAAAAAAEGRCAAAAPAAAAFQAGGSAAIAVPQEQQGQQGGPSSDTDTAASMLLQGGQGSNASRGSALDSTASTGPPLPFGSPVLSAVVPPPAGGSTGGGNSGAAQLAVAPADAAQSSEGSTLPRDQSCSGSTTGDAAAIWAGAGSVEDSKQQQSPGSSRWQRAAALLRSAGSAHGLQFAAGVVAGVASCCLLMAVACGVRSRPAGARITK